MADEIKLKAPTVEQQVVVNINGEDKLKSFADTLDKISNNKNLQKYWKTQQDLINATADAYSNFQKKASKDNASELIKVTNALKAMSGTDLSHILPNFDKISKSMSEAQKVAGNIDSAFSVKGFKEAFDSFETLKAYGTDIQKLFSHFGVSSDIGELQQNVRLLEGEVEKLTRRLSNARNANEELRNEFENFKVGSGFADKLDELDRLKAEMQNIRDEATQTFNQFLDANKIDRYDWFSDDRFAEYFEKLENGTLTATDAIRRFKSEYSYLLEDSYKSSGDSFGLDQLQAFSTKLDSIFHQVEETSNKINDILSNGVIAKSVQNLSEDTTLSNSQRSIFGNILQDEESLKSITALFQKLIDETNQTKNTEVFNAEQFTKLESLFISIESSLSSIKGVLVDVGDGEELSPLLKQLDNIREATSNIKLSLNLDLGNEVSERLNQKVSQSTQRQLEAYRKLFSAMKGTGKTNKEMLKFFEPDEASATELIGAYQGIIKRAEEQFKVGNSNAYKKLLGSTYDDLKKEIKNANAQLGRAENKRSENGILGDLFGNSKDLSGVIEQLNTIVSKLDEISVSAKGFAETFKNGLNVNASVDEIEKLTNRVKELESELAKIKIPTTVATPQESNISLASDSTVEQQIKSESELNAEIEKRENIIRELQQLQEKLTVHEDFHDNDRYFADQLPTEEEIREADKRIKQLTGTNNIFNVDKLIQDRNEWLSEVKYSLEEYDDLIKVNDQKALDEYTTRGLSRIGGAESFFGYEDNNFSIASKFVEEKEKIQNEINDLYTDLDKLDEKMNLDSNNSSVDNTVQSQEKLQSELKETQKQAEKTTQAVKEVSSTASQDQTKDAFPDKDVSTSVESATNSIKEENNVLEQNTQKVKENADAKKKLTDTDKEVSNVNLSKYDNRLESYTKKTSGYDTTIARFENGGWTSDTYKQRINAVKEAVKQYADILNNLKKHPELVNDEELGKLDKQERLIKDNIIAVQNMSAAEKGYSLISAQKELDKINNILKEHSGMSREAKNQIKAYYAEIKSGNPSASLDVIHGKIMQIVNAEIEAGRGGKSMFDAIKEKAWYGVASAIGTYFGFNDLIRYGKEGVSIVRQLDTALTEMRKVSNESVQSLKKYQDTTFDTADAVGTTAKQIQNSTADWMRLGESMDTAAKSAKDANILLNVSEFEGIDEATESLVSMSQAYKDLDKMDIIDVLNNIGNNYSISTDGLATALKDSASALVTANNDLNEAVSLTTAGNAITQDPSKVGAGLRTISLRLVGTEQAKQELSDLGEETDGMITTVSKLRDTIMDATKAASKDGKGFDILDDNGNYKSTYEIMQGLADFYDDIVKKDKELGTNNLNLLLETIAGKNRSNIAASILQNGDMLRSVYEDAQNSEGSAEKELNSYLDSVDGKFQQLQNRTQEFWYNVIDTTTVKSILDFTTDLTEGASKFFKLVEKHLPTILGAIATIIASNKSGGLIRLINFINNSPFLATVEFNREVYELIV